MSATRSYVNAFADDMEEKLAFNRHKGDREGWAKDDPDSLFRRLEDEVEELRFVLHELRNLKQDGLNHGPHARSSRISIRSECADIANFAMMIADVAGGMKPKQ